MKCIAIPFFFLASLFVTKSFAQQGAQIQVLGGGQSTWMFNQADSDEGDALDYQPTFGSHYGIKAAFFFTDKIGLETGFIISQQGQDYEHQINIGNQEVNYETSRTLTYSKIPVLLHLRSQPDEPAYFSAMIGPQFSLLNDLSSSSDNALGKGAWGEKADYESTVTDVVLAFGPGFSLSDKLKLDVHFRFDYGLTDAEDKSSDHWKNPLQDEERPDTHNATGALQVGLTYGFGG
jgi:hypothetical protein